MHDHGIATNFTHYQIVGGEDVARVGAEFDRAGVDARERWRRAWAPAQAEAREVREEMRRRGEWS